MTNICNDLKNLLETEREILLAGEFEKLPEITDRKQALRECLGEKTQSRSAADLAKLKDLSQLNDRLMRASLDGLGAVKDRLKLIQDIQNKLTTYGGDGKISHTINNLGSVERRA